MPLRLGEEIQALPWPLIFLPVWHHCRKKPLSPFFTKGIMESIMSLNCEEIDLILSEEPLEGAKIQNIFQPAFDTIVLELYVRQKAFFYLISISHSACRLHPLSAPPPKNDRPLRFMECLRARIRGGTIISARQLGKDRIVDFEIARSNSEGMPQRLHLYARLWSGAGNILLVDDNSIIIDAMRRLPSRHEVSGAGFSPPSEAGETKASSPLYAVRELPGEGHFWKRAEAFYAAHSGQLSLETLRPILEERFLRRKQALERRLSALEETLKEYSLADRYRQIGDILLSGYAIQKEGAKTFAEAFDFYEQRELLIEIDPKLDPPANAALYYEKYRKARDGKAEVESELSRVRASLVQLEQWYSRYSAETDPFVLARALKKGGTARTRQKDAYPCLHAEYRGWTILVGRSAKENDELLRHVVKGSDLWLHARDYPGSYVFIKAQKNKSIPPEVMNAAARLAIYYSKARKNASGDVHMTYVKNLRRVKNGPVGLVIPYLEKNLYISFTESQIRDILSDTATEEEPI